MFQRIMVALDGSSRAEGVLPYAVLLAGAYQAQLCLVSVVDPGTLEGGPEHQDYLSQLAERAGSDAGKYLAPVAQRLRNQQRSVQEQVVTGRPGETLTAHAEEAGADLIAMSTHGHSGVGRWLFGSVTDQVLHLTRTPMLVIRPPARPAAEDPKLKTLVVPLDGSSLAEVVLPHARDLARRLGLRVILIRVLQTSVFAPGQDIAPIPEEVLTDVEAGAEAYLAGVGQQFAGDGVAYETRVLRGPVAATLVDFARAEPNNLVAISTHGRSGVGRAVLGSVADRLIRAGGDAVFVVRPQQV